MIAPSTAPCTIRFMAALRVTAVGTAHPTKKSALIQPVRNSETRQVLIREIRGFEFSYVLVSEAGWFWEAILDRAGQDNIYGVVECAAVADGDEQRFDIGSGSQDGADDILGFGVVEVFETTFGFGRFFISADQAALGAADGGFVEEQAQMGGDAHPAGVGDSLAVDHEAVRLDVELFDGRQAGRRFAERQQAGDIGHGDRLEGLL